MFKRCRPLPDLAGGFSLNGQWAKSGLNKSIYEASWGKFIKMIDYKVESTGWYAIAVNPRNPPQVCPGCGTMVKKTSTNASLIAPYAFFLCIELIMHLSIY